MIPNVKIIVANSPIKVPKPKIKEKISAYTNVGKVLIIDKTNFITIGILVDNKKVAVQAGSFQYPLEDAGLNIIYGISNMGVSLDDVLGALDEEIASIKSELISEREYQKIRNQQESSFVFNFGSNSGIASALATYEAYQGDANLINTEIDKYLAVTKEDIKRVANKYLNKENRLVLYWMPGTGE